MLERERAGTWFQHEAGTAGELHLAARLDATLGDALGRLGESGQGAEQEQQAEGGCRLHYHPPNRATRRSAASMKLNDLGHASSRAALLAAGLPPAFPRLAK